MKNALMDVLKSRLFWYAVFACLLFCLGIHFYTQWDLARFEAEMPPVPRRLTSDTTVETPGDISLETETDTQDGHFHEDGTWHAEPHAAVEVSEAEVSDDVQGAPVGAQQANTQREAPMQESAASKAADLDVVRAWVEWHKKADEIYAKELQANQALIDALPSTEAEQERYETDENFKREVGRKVTEAGKKIGEAVRMRQAHEEKRPSPPTQ